MTHFLILADFETRRRVLQVVDQGGISDQRVFTSSRLEDIEGLAHLVAADHDLILITEDTIDGHNADHIAMTIKTIKFTARVFVFSSEHARRLIPNGTIPKDVDLLLRFIRSVQDHGYDLARLKTEFPQIKFTAEPSTR